MALLLISLYGLMLRVWQLASPSYWMDESFSIATAQALLAGDVIARSPLYHVLLGLSGVISNWHIIGLRGLSVLVGVTMICVGYRIAKRWFTVPIALVYAAFLSLSTIDIAWSRQIRMYALLQLFFWLSLYCYQQWRTGKLHWLFPLLTTLATIATHEFGFYLVLVYLWYELLVRVRRPMIPIIILFVLVFICVHIFNPTLPFINYWWHYLYFLGTQQIVYIVLAIIGVITIQKKYAFLAQWLWLTWFGWLFVLSFIIPLLQYRYLFMTFPLVLLFVANGFVWLWRHQWFGKVACGLAIGLLIWQQQIMVLPQSFYALESDPPGASFTYKTFTPQPNYAEAYTFLQTQPSVPIATPYPIIHQLYTHQWPKYVVFVNITGGDYPTIPDTEHYSQLPYTDPNTLPTDQETLLLLDQFSEYRLDNRWRSIMAQSEVIWEDKNPPWSDLRIYRIVPL